MKTLLELEKIRKKILSKFFILRIISVIATFFFTFFMLFYILLQFPVSFSNLNDIKSFDKIIAIFISLCVVFVVYKRIFNYLVKEESKEFINKYKDYYLLQYFNKLGYKYNKFGHVHALDIIKSALFPPFDKQSGNDQVNGEIDGVRFVFSDLVLQNIEEKTDWRSGYVHKEYITLFTGLFFVANFNKNINSKTFVMSRDIPNVKDVKMIKMDNMEFNKFFNVYTTDIQNAMYILTPALMENILKLAKKMNVPISISFVENKIFIKIDKGYDSFEPDIKYSIISKNLAPIIKQEIESILEIVKVLKLNNKMWFVSYNKKDEKDFYK